MISPYPACDSRCRGPSPKWGIATSGMWRESWASSSLQMSLSPFRTCKSISLNGLGNWSAIPGEHEDELKLCERRVMRAMLSWNVVTANETDKLRPAVLFDIIISFASAFILATFKSKKKKKKTWLCLIWSEHFSHFRECCDIGRSGLGIAGQLDESRSSTTSSFVFFRRCSLTSPFHLHQNCKTCLLWAFSFLFPAPCMCQDCRTSPPPFSNVSVPQCPSQSMPSTVSYSFPDPPPSPLPSIRA